MSDPERTRIPLRFASSCLVCSTRVAAGTYAWWSPSHGVVCGNCHSRGRRPQWREPERVRARVVAHQLSGAQLIGSLPSSLRGSR